MGFLDLFLVASMPVLKVLIVTGIGLYLAIESVDIMGETTRKQMNKVAFFVFNPALVGSSLARTITLDSMVKLWFMPVNVFITFVVGSAFGWIITKVARAPKHLKGLVIGCCAAGNLGNLPVIIIPAVCKEKGSPFGAPDVCRRYGLGFASLSMALGAVFLWSYVYNIVRVSSMNIPKEAEKNDTTDDMKSVTEAQKPLLDSCESPLPALKCSSTDDDYLILPSTNPDAKTQVSICDKTKKFFVVLSRVLNLKSLFAPSTTGAAVGFVIGGVPLIRKLIIGSEAPLRVLEDSASLLGEAAIPTVTLIMGGNLLRGLKGRGISWYLVVGIIAVRYVFLPLFGMVIVKSALRLGLLEPDPLYIFVLLLQYALPPAMNIGTITQLFGAGESECSVVMLWTYSLASVSLTLWSTFFMWLVS